MLSRILVPLAVVAAVLSAPRPALAIANGADARTGAFDFSVLLEMTGLPADGGGTRDSSCSGALIAPSWVITAGHCFRDASGQRVGRTVAEKTTAIIGRTALKTFHGYEVSVVAVHQAAHTDVALAELASPITGITPIPLATTAPITGEVLRLTGFGLTADGTPPSRMQTGLFTVGGVNESTLEASGRSPHADTSPCPHDSGGPYFREEPLALVAVVSTGPGCPHPGPDYSARVDNLGEWIAGTMTPSSWRPWTAAGVLVAAAVLVAIGYRRAHVRPRRRAPGDPAAFAADLSRAP
ncbi:S1 family peptidase [Actinoplanes sp. NPDC023714]|uniref:S1 family peptidase n=1 Tax=Actinoplanes sp. NPDC023714 TaxID=3154322 RepID=UPI0033FF56DC